jgi:hypothetical protein
MNVYYNFIFSFICFITVYALHVYDVWWYKNKTQNKQLDNFDKTVRPVKNFGLKIMLFLMGLIFFSKAFI